MGCGASRDNRTSVSQSAPEPSAKTTAAAPTVENKAADDAPSPATSKKTPLTQVHMSVSRAVPSCVMVEWVAPEPRTGSEWLGVFRDYSEGSPLDRCLKRAPLPQFGTKGTVEMDGLGLEVDRTYTLLYVGSKGDRVATKTFVVEVNPNEDAQYGLEMIRKRESSVTVRFTAPPAAEDNPKADFVAIYERSAADGDYIAFAYCAGESGTLTIQRLNLSPGVTYHARYITTGPALVAKKCVSFEVDVAVPESGYKLQAAIVTTSSVLVLYQVPANHPVTDKIGVFPFGVQGSSQDLALGFATVPRAACGTVNIKGLVLEEGKRYHLLYLRTDGTVGGSVDFTAAHPTKPP